MSKIHEKIEFDSFDNFDRTRLMISSFGNSYVINIYVLGNHKSFYYRC